MKIAAIVKDTGASVYIVGFLGLDVGSYRCVVILNDGSFGSYQQSELLCTDQAFGFFPPLKSLNDLMSDSEAKKQAPEKSNKNQGVEIKKK